MVRASDKLELAAAVTSKNPTPEELAAELDLPKNIVFDDYRQAIGSSECDIVAVVVPPALHLPVIEAALQAGKHVICEKPLADTWEAAVKIAQLVKSYPHQTVMVSQTRRYVPQVQTVRKFIAEGKLGKVNYINFDHSVYDPDNYGWRLDLYSVVLEDMSAHHFDLFRYITCEEPGFGLCRGLAAGLEPVSQQGVPQRADSNDRRCACQLLRHLDRPRQEEHI